MYTAANIAGHVGSDITAGVITTDLMDCDKGHLFIDIGTNGEIVLTGNGRAVACSTAAGPAFEGSSITQGMRAARRSYRESRYQRGFCGHLGYRRLRTCRNLRLRHYRRCGRTDPDGHRRQVGKTSGQKKLGEKRGISRESSNTSERTESPVISCCTSVKTARMT